MGYTQLSPTGTPGRPYTFGAVSKGDGPFTSLSALGAPGQIHSFTAKTAAGKGDGPFTSLSVLGTPGQIHSFLAKTEAEVIEAVEGGGGSKGRLDALKMKTARLHQEDQDILEFVMSFVLNR